MAWHIISKPDCIFCEKAKELLKSCNLSWTEEVCDTPEKQEVFRNRGFKSYPQIWEGTHMIGGFTELVDHLDF